MMVLELQLVNYERLGLPHSLRKGFASQLTKHGVEKGRIAWIGRWKLPDAIYIYISYDELCEKKTTRYFFHRKNNTEYEFDFDNEEYMYFMNSHTTSRKGSIDWLKTFEQDL